MSGCEVQTPCLRLSRLGISLLQWKRLDEFRSSRIAQRSPNLWRRAWYWSVIWGPLVFNKTEIILYCSKFLLNVQSGVMLQYVLFCWIKSLASNRRIDWCNISIHDALTKHLWRLRSCWSQSLFLLPSIFFYQKLNVGKVRWGRTTTFWILTWVHTHLPKFSFLQLVYKDVVIGYLTLNEGWLKKIVGAAIVRFNLMPLLILFIPCNFSYFLLFRSGSWHTLTYILFSLVQNSFLLTTEKGFGMEGLALSELLKTYGGLWIINYSSLCLSWLSS